MKIFMITILLGVSFLFPTATYAATETKTTIADSPAASPKKVLVSQAAYSNFPHFEAHPADEQFTPYAILNGKTSGWVGVINTVDRAQLAWNLDERTKQVTLYSWDIKPENEAILEAILSAISRLVSQELLPYRFERKILLEGSLPAKFTTALEKAGYKLDTTSSRQPRYCFSLPDPKEPPELATHPLVKSTKGTRLVLAWPKTQHTGTLRILEWHWPWTNAATYTYTSEPPLFSVKIAEPAWGNGLIFLDAALKKLVEGKDFAGKPMGVTYKSPSYALQKQLEQIGKPSAATGVMGAAWQLKGWGWVDYYSPTRENFKASADRFEGKD